MNEKLPDDQKLWFRNLPPKAIDEPPAGAHERLGEEPVIELFIEPLTGLTIPISLKNKNDVSDQSRIIEKLTTQHSPQTMTLKQFYKFI